MYTHIATGVQYPVAIDDYKRATIRVFDEQSENLGVTYKMQNGSGETVISVFIYPAGPATDSRFWEQYIYSIISISGSSSAANIRFAYRPYISEKGKIHGLRASMPYPGGKKAVLELYECGHWFVKIRTTTDGLDSAGVSNLNNKILDIIDPVKIARQKGYWLATTISLPPAMPDTVAMAWAIAGALGKGGWVNKHLEDSLEFMSGFPFMYLDVHLAAVEAQLKYADKSSGTPRQKVTDKFIDQVKSLRDAGYLDEFFMDDYKNVLIQPKGWVFDFEGYKRWKKSNKIKINATQQDYGISFREIE